MKPHKYENGFHRCFIDGSLHAKEFVGCDCMLVRIAYDAKTAAMKRWAAICLCGGLGLAALFTIILFWENLSGLFL